MKKTTLLLMFCAFGTSLFAQDDENKSEPLKPEQGTIGIGFDISGLASVAFSNWNDSGNGLSSAMLALPTSGPTINAMYVSDIVPQQMLFGRYYLSQDVALRLGLGINSTNRTVSETVFAGPDTFQTETVSETTLKAFSFGVGVGIEKHFMTEAKRLDPYGGLHFTFASLGKINMTSSTDVNQPDTLIDSFTKYEANLAGGTAFGVNLLAGFNYFFSDNFSLGAEVGWGFQSVNMGGDWDETSTVEYSGPNAPDDPDPVTNNGTYTSKNSGFGVGATAGVNASIFW